MFAEPIWPCSRAKQQGASRAAARCRDYYAPGGLTLTIYAQRYYYQRAADYGSILFRRNRAYLLPTFQSLLVFLYLKTILAIDWFGLRCNDWQYYKLIVVVVGLKGLGFGGRQNYVASERL